VKITGLIWLTDIIEKLERKHHIQQEEVREERMSMWLRGELTLAAM